MQKFLATLAVIFFALSGQSQSSGFSSDVPIVLLETHGDTIADEPRIVVDMSIINNNHGDRNYITDQHFSYQGKVSIEIRGSTSQDFSKKQYILETQTIEGDNENVSLLGLPAENDWILSAPYTDKSLIRNMLAYNLSIKLGHYAPRTRVCELFLNDEYKGVYILTEKIKRDKNRVDVLKHNSEANSEQEVSGGYIIKIDRWDLFCSGWKSEKEQIYLQYEYPKCEDITLKQKEYIQNFLNAFEESLFDEHRNIPYSEYVDMNSLVDYFIVNEIAKNIDAYRLSAFMYKHDTQDGGKLGFGPVWDFNIAFGNADYLDGHTVDGFIAPRHIWWEQLLQDSLFVDSLRNRWRFLRQRELSNADVFSLVDSLSGLVSEAQVRNFKKWDNLGYYIWPNAYVGGSYMSELKYLKYWIFKRLEWMDSQLLNYEGGEGINKDNFSIYPNPFSYYFTIQVEIKEKCMLSIKLHDINGNMVEEIQPTAEYKSGRHNIVWDCFFDKSALSDGMYFIVVEANGKVIGTKKILKSGK